MRIILLGAPAVGKGTHADLLARKFNIPHISTGDIFRENIKKQTDLGKKVQQYVDNGLLVPDDLVIGIIKERIILDDCKNGFIFDGFPRTAMQAVYLDNLLEELKLKIDKVINICLPDEQVKMRIMGRRVCENCGATYHVVARKPFVEGICDKCNSRLIQRQDDTEAKVDVRLNSYREQTEPIVEYYKKSGVLIVIDSQESDNVDIINEKIVKELKGSVSCQ